QAWTVLADESGGFVTTWHVCEDDCFGATLEATADGESSGLHAEVLFTDAVCPAPSISSQPADATKCPGDPVTFSVTATDTGTLTYQWRKNNAAIAGATAASYTIGAVTAADVGSYDVQITNTASGCSPKTVNSSNATLTVVPP